MSAYFLQTIVTRQSYGTATDKREAKMAQVELDELEATDKKMEKVEMEISNLIHYREFNTTNFQLEKLDDYLNRLRDLLQ